MEVVHAAVTETWSNGPLAALVDRLKTITRQIFGRAGFELLRARVFNAAWSRSVTVGNLVN
jgi:transposase